ncbi:MAG: GNAT family N-acetyltransferase [Clostridia bacterium]|nr:GNAT family N-acetyltransferase [Clostridia bacterium]
MTEIRKATQKDISRIAEILVFTKRLNYRSIFHNDQYSFGEMQVLSVAQEYLDNPNTLNDIWVYYDEFVRGLIHIEGKEVKKLYVDSFFESEGIGGKLIEFAIQNFDVRYLWVLEKNERAVSFYEKHGFHYKNEWQYEEGTTEHLLKMER